jgi:hypothetical protein
MVDKFNILPHDIEVSEHLWHAFNDYKTEELAGRIIRFFQSRDSWDPFNAQEFNDFFKKKGYGSSPLAFAVDQGWIIQGEEKDVFYIEESFIERCYKASPKKKE